MSRGGNVGAPVFPLPRSPVLWPPCFDSSWTTAFPFCLGAGHSACPRGPPCPPGCVGGSHPPLDAALHLLPPPAEAAGWGAGLFPARCTRTRRPDWEQQPPSRPTGNPHCCAVTLMVLLTGRFSNLSAAFEASAHGRLEPRPGPPPSLILAFVGLPRLRVPLTPISVESNTRCFDVKSSKREHEARGAGQTVSGIQIRSPRGGMGGPAPVCRPVLCGDRSPTVGASLGAAVTDAGGPEQATGGARVGVSWFQCFCRQNGFRERRVCAVAAVLCPWDGNVTWPPGLVPAGSEGTLCACLVAQRFSGGLWVGGVSLRICPSSSAGRVMVGSEGLYLRHMAVCLTQRGA